MGISPALESLWQDVRGGLRMLQKQPAFAAAANYATAALALVVVALGASYLPIRRVLRTDPARALRG